MRTKEDPRQKNRVRPDKTFKKAFSDAFFEKRNTFEKKKKMKIADHKIKAIAYRYLFRSNT